MVDYHRSKVGTLGPHPEIYGLGPKVRASSVLLA
jgi:hypothetical protein